MKYLFPFLFCACNGASFDHPSDRADAGALASPDAGSSRLVVDLPPWLGLPPSLSALGDPDAGAADAAMPAPALSPDAATTDAASPLASHPVPGAPPPLPAALQEHLTSLRSLGFSDQACAALVTAVESCCSSGAAAFRCQQNCTCGAVGYGVLTDLCSPAPSGPIDWRCEQ